MCAGTPVYTGQGIADDIIANGGSVGRRMQRPPRSTPAPWQSACEECKITNWQHMWPGCHNGHPDRLEVKPGLTSFHSWKVRTGICFFSSVPDLFRRDSCTKSIIQLSLTPYFALHDSLRDMGPNRP